MTREQSNYLRNLCLSKGLPRAEAIVLTANYGTINHAYERTGPLDAVLKGQTFDLAARSPGWKVPVWLYPLAVMRPDVREEMFAPSMTRMFAHPICPFRLWPYKRKPIPK